MCMTVGGGCVLCINMFFMSLMQITAGLCHTLDRPESCVKDCAHKL